MESLIVRTFICPLISLFNLLWQYRNVKEVYVSKARPAINQDQLVASGSFYLTLMLASNRSQLRAYSSRCVEVMKNE